MPKGIWNRPRPTPLERFWTKFQKMPSGCWEWQGYRDRDGYGQFNVYRRQRMQAHRYSYEMIVGPIPDGLQIDHLCRNTSCVNPAHLEPVTCQVNLLRGETFQAKNAVKTHCPRGHEYTEDNTYRAKNGSRSCRACIKMYPKWRAEREMSGGR